MEKEKFLSTSILIAAGVIGGAIIFAAIYRGGAPIATVGTRPNDTAGNADVMKLGPRDAVLGSANAPVTLIEYGDYQCPFCGIFFEQVEQPLRKNYIDTGKVKMVFRDFAFLGPESTAAANAANCAKDQNQFWAYHDAIYIAEIADGRENNGNLDRDLFLSLAKSVKLDTAAFTKCLDSNQDAAAIAAEYAAGQAAGVNSTPTTFINGKKVTDANGNSVGANATAILSAVAAALK